MKRTTTNSSTQQFSSSRCSYMTSGGRRCRMPASPDSPYCRSHAKNTTIITSTLAAELSQAAGSLAAPEDVNRVLAKIFLALAADRLSTRKAAVLGYLGQMLLRSHREIAFHKKLADEVAKRNDSGPPVVIDIAGMTDEAPTPAVTPQSQGPASFANLECGGLPPLSQPPTTPTNHNSTPTEPTASQPFTDPSQPNPPLADLNHFYPRDPALPPTLQHPRNTTVPPDEEESRWHELSLRYAPARRRT
jgi:hypothetical protein